jgi:uncharacterized protein DUF4338
MTDENLKSYSVTTPLFEIEPNKIEVVQVSSGVIAYYQKQMSRAVWRPAFGRKLGFLVIHEKHLLGLIFLASPVLALSVRDTHLFSGMAKEEKGKALQGYMDMSVCVAAQPIGWHWNLGKLMAMIAYTLGDFVEERYGQKLVGVTTTSVFGGNKATQYSRIYKHLGETEGTGHESVDDAVYKKMMAFLRLHCSNCTPDCKNPLPLAPTKTQAHDGKGPEKWCTVPGCVWRKECCKEHGKSLGDGASPRRRRIAAFFKALETLNLTPLAALGVEFMGHDLIQVRIEKRASTHHNNKRGVYYHPAVSPTIRSQVIKDWYVRFGLPRYEKTESLIAPYQNGGAYERGTYK